MVFISKLIQTGAIFKIFPIKTKYSKQKVKNRIKPLSEPFINYITKV